MATRIACSPLTGRIHSGQVSRDGTHFVGQKRDVTSDVLGALIEKAEYHGGTFEIEACGKKWTVTVAAAGEGGEP